MFSVLLRLPNYGGKAVCFYPTSDTDCTPSFFPTSTDLFGLAGSIGSAARGCFAKDVVFAEKAEHAVKLN